MARRYQLPGRVQKGHKPDRANHAEIAGPEHADDFIVFILLLIG